MICEKWLSKYGVAVHPKDIPHYCDTCDAFWVDEESCPHTTDARFGAENIKKNIIAWAPYFKRFK